MGLIYRLHKLTKPHTVASLNASVPVLTTRELFPADPPEGAKPVVRAAPLAPKHRFKIGEWHSAHNYNGFDRVLERVIGSNLQHTVSYDKSKEWYGTQWEFLKAYLTEARRGLLEHIATTQGHDVFPIEMLGNQNVHDEAEALLKYRSPLKGGERLAIQKEGVYFKGVEVRAVMMGMDAGVPTLYVHAQRTDWNFYLEGLDIALETVQWVLSQPDPKRYVLRITNLSLI